MFSCKGDGLTVGQIDNSIDLEFKISQRDACARLLAFVIDDEKETFLRVGSN